MSQGRLPLFIIHLKRHFLDEKVLFFREGGDGDWCSKCLFCLPKKVLFAPLIIIPEEGGE